MADAIEIFVWGVLLFIGGLVGWNLRGIHDQKQRLARNAEKAREREAFKRYGTQRNIAGRIANAIRETCPRFNVALKDSENAGFTISMNSDTDLTDLAIDICHELGNTTKPWQISWYPLRGGDQEYSTGTDDASVHEIIRKSITYLQAIA